MVNGEALPVNDATESEVNAPDLLGVGGAKPVSYTHLDVYKRQKYMWVATLTPARLLRALTS